MASQLFHLKQIMINEYGWEYTPNKQRIVAMWAIINKNNSFNVRHNHQNCYLSASYYVKKPQNSGNITFHDPKEAKTYRFHQKKVLDIVSILDHFISVEVQYVCSG